PCHAPAHGRAESRRDESTNGVGNLKFRWQTAATARASRRSDRYPFVPSLRAELARRTKETWRLDRGRFQTAPKLSRRRAMPNASGSAPRWRPWRRGRGHISDKHAGSLLRAGHAQYRDRYPAVRRVLWK